MDTLQLLIYTGIYFIPSIIAFDRKHEDKRSILWFNIIFGFTIVGWFLALAWAVADYYNGNYRR